MLTDHLDLRVLLALGFEKENVIVRSCILRGSEALQQSATHFTVTILSQQDFKCFH